MGKALALGALKAGAVQAGDLIAFDIHPLSVDSFVAESGATAAESLANLSKQSDILLLCTKPHDIPAVLKAVSSETKDHLAISIAAGVTLRTMEKVITPRTRLIRCMPNTPALVGKGAAAFTRGKSATREDANVAQQILGSVGEVVEVEESLMDVVTGLSGSGPAYVYLMIEALTDAAVSHGLTEEQARTLAVQTTLGAATMVQQTGQSPSALRDMVSSPGGTTIAGLAALEKAGFRKSCQQAVDAATARSKELGTSESSPN